VISPVIQSKREELNDLCRRFRVKRMELFGSAARGDFDPERSDLDFLVEFERLPPADYMDAYFSLKEALELMFGRPIDVVTKSSVVNPYFRESIESTSELLYAV
jgi:uncharacterized protein